MLRTCLFDMGNVLVFFSHDQMCEQMGRLCGLSGSEIQRLLIESGRQWDYERGWLNPAQFHDWFRKVTGAEVGLPDLIQASSDIFQLNEPIVPILDRLKERGLRLVLLSNTCQTHFEWVRDHFDVLQRFDGFVTSYQAGAIKPEPAIFRAALDQIGCAPHECFYTDDIATYVHAGREFGLQAETFIGVPDLIEQLRGLGTNV